MTSISPAELRERLENGDDVCIADIRAPEEYNAERIEGSQNLPIREDLLAGNIDEALAQLDDLPSETEIVTVCDAGHASGETARLLRERGYDASVLDGGFQAWTAEDDE
jgi:rhodanese-related sulfurtransferase